MVMSKFLIASIGAIKNYHKKYHKININKTIIKIIIISIFILIYGNDIDSKSGEDTDLPIYVNF